MSRSDNEVAVVRRGRRPGGSSTRETVLEAARGQFACKGFAATTIRGVAEAAGVDASLVMQFYSSKQGLFAAVMSVPPSVLERLTAAFEGPQEHVGDRVVRAFLNVWEGDPADAEPLMAMLRGAVVHELAREQLREYIQARLLDGVNRRPPFVIDGGAISDGDAALRAGVASSMLVGLILGRRIIEVPTLADAEHEDLIHVVAPAIHQVLTGKLCWTP